MIKEQKSVIGTPIELTEVMATSEKARSFYESLPPTLKNDYNEWVGGVKQEKTRRARAVKALLLLELEKKTLTTKV